MNPFGKSFWSLLVSAAATIIYAVIEAVADED